MVVRLQSSGSKMHRYRFVRSVIARVLALGLYTTSSCGFARRLSETLRDNYNTARLRDAHAKDGTLEC